MNETVTVIDVVAQLTDETASGASSAQSNVSKLEKAMMNLQKQIQGMKGKSKLEVMATLKDMASKGIQGVAAAGKKIAGKVWTVTLKAVDLVTAPFRKVLGLIANPVTQAAAFAGISFGLADAMNTFKDFEAAMSQVRAISGASESDMEKLTATAKEMGATTKFTATEAAEALNYMALAGYNTETSIAMLPNVLNLAAAGGIDLASASDMVTDAQSALGLTLEQTEAMVNQMAITSSKTNTSVAQLGEAFLTVGGTAKDLSGGVTELSTMLGVLADNGVKGSEGGTALRNIILSLSAPTDKAAKTLKSLGVQAFDAEGKMRPLPETFLDLQGALKNLTDEQQTRALAEIFNSTDLKSVNALLGTSAERYNKLADVIGNAGGAAAKMAGTMEDNLAGSLHSLQSAADGVKIAIGEKLQPYVRGLADWATAHMPDIQNAVGQAVDFFTGKIDDVIASVKEMTHSPEWQNAETLWQKIQFAWDKLIAEPFDEWWNGTGKAWLEGKAAEIGAGLGTALHDGIMTLLGVDAESTAADAVSVGKSFADGFLEGFDGKAVAAALWNAIKSGLKSLTADAATLLPGGEKASSTSLLSTGVLGYGALKTAMLGTGALNIGLKAIRAVKTSRDMISGLRIAGAAANGGQAAGSAFRFAQAGELGAGTQLGATIGSGVINFGSKAALKLGAGHLAGGAAISAGALSALGLGAVAGGLTGGGTAISGLFDIYRASKAKNRNEKDMYRDTAGMKLGGVASGAAAGAAIGSVVLGPGFGTVAGGLIGAGIGGIAGLIGSNKRKKEYEEATAAAEAEAAAQELVAAKSFITGRKLEDIRFGTEALNNALNDTNVSAEQFAALFEEATTRRIVDAFGDITLSMQEISSLADALVFDEAMESVENFESAVASSSKALDNVKDRLGSIDKWNWKASLGIGFTAQDSASYQSAVDSFLQDATAYVSDKHYEATAAVQLITGGEGDLTGLNDVYVAIKDQLSAKSTELTAAVQTALEDGVIATEPVMLPDGTVQLSEYEEILGLQNQISDIVSKVAAAENEARLDVLQIKYGGSNLDAASFQALQAELAANVESMTLSYDEALQVGLTNLRLQFEGLSEEELQHNPEFQAQVAALKESYQQQIAGLNIRVEGFQLDTIAEAFQTELSQAFGTVDTSEISASLQETMNTALAVEPDAAKWTAEDITQWFGLDRLDTETQTAIAATIQGVAETIPHEVKTQLAESLGSMDLSAAQEKIQSVLGMDIAEAIESTDLSEAYKGIETLRTLIEKQADITMGAEMPMDIPVKITYTYTQTNANPPMPNIQTLNRASSYMGGALPPVFGDAKHRATGGFTSGPEISLIGEDGPEAIIPLGAKRRERGISLWEKAGQMLGAIPRAEGGIFGGMPVITTGEEQWIACTTEPLPEPTTNASSAESLSVTIENVNFEINVDGGNAQDPQALVETIKENVRGMTDEIAYQLAMAIQQVFANTPKAAW